MFFCPECRERREHKHKRVRRFFTLYFIPLIPLDLLGEYVECQHCTSTYKLNVLEYDPEKEHRHIEREANTAIRRIMVMMLLADGVVDAEEVEVVRVIYNRFTQLDLSEQEVLAEITEAKSDNRSIEEFASTLVGFLNVDGREMVLRCALMVALADGEFHATEQELLKNIATALQMSPAHFKGVLAEFMDMSAEAS